MGSVNHTERSRAKVLEQFAACGRVDLACERAGVDRGNHYRWLKKYPDYKAAFNAAHEQAVDLLEDRARERVMDTANPSDRLLEFLLKGLRPDKYGDRMKNEHSGPGGSAIPTKVTVEFVRPGGSPVIDIPAVKQIEK